MGSRARNTEGGIGKHWRTIADVVAVLVFAAIVVIGAKTIEADDQIAAPTTVTTVTKDAVAKTSGTRKETTEVTKTGKEPATKKTTTELQGGTPAKPAETQVTTEEGERSFIERAFGEGGLTILQVALVVLAAFFAAAIVQRVLVGEYGGFEFGSFKLSSVARTSAAGLKELRDKVDKLEADVDKKVKVAEESRLREDLEIREDLAIAYKRMDLIDKRLDNLNSGRRPPPTGGQSNA